jgi:hypothetical protein
MSNPYQPPQEPSENRLSQLLVPSTYVGGKLAVLALGVIAGAVAGVLIYASLDLNTPVPAFGAPAIIWIVTLIALMLMLRGAELQAATKIWLPLLLAIPAYVLYVPVCTFSSMMTTSFMGSNGYGPTGGGLVLASVVTFVLILLIFAAIVRRQIKQPVRPDDVGGDTTNQSDFTEPFHEPTNE